MIALRKEYENQVCVVRYFGWWMLYSLGSMSQHQEIWIVWMPFSRLLHRMYPYFKNIICSVRRCGLYLQEMWNFLKPSQSTSRSFGRVPWSYKPLKSLAFGKKLQYSLSSSQATIKALCDFLGYVLIKSAIVKREMRLEISKICTWWPFAHFSEGHVVSPLDLWRCFTSVSADY